MNSPQFRNLNTIIPPALTVKEKSVSKHAHLNSIFVIY